MKIYIVRHGETALNAEGVLQGRLNEPLNQNGRELAEITGKAMKDIHFDYCISSPLDRAKETAEKMGVRFLGEVPLHIDIRTHADEGKPIVEDKPESPQAAAYMEIAKKLV